MLHEFLAAERTALIDRCHSKVALRSSIVSNDRGLDHGIPLFLDQLVETLRLEHLPDQKRARDISGPSGGGPAAGSEIGLTAARHGRELFEHGVSLDQVVHDYGDLCQAITEVAFERDIPIRVPDFQTLNRCLDNAIASAVTEFTRKGNARFASAERQTLNEELGTLAHELRNYLHTATLAIAAIKAGKVGMSGATASVLDRSILGMRGLVDRSLADVRLSAGMRPRHRLISVAEFIREVEAAISLEAERRGCLFTVSVADAQLAVDVDPDVLFSAVGNLLQNAFKFTRPGTEVRLTAYGAADRVRIDVEDACGGLPDGNPDHLFVPFTQRGADVSGMGLGLTICQRSVEASNALLSVCDKPGVGCVFTIDLPRRALQ